ncbi:hypothetical protein BGX29_001222 [Mortierella sp. GBA35]|nr:hypothetical protein BGX29_001222 [Mortierella sp. GBA35]
MGQSLSTSSSSSSQSRNQRRPATTTTNTSMTSSSSSSSSPSNHNNNNSHRHQQDSSNMRPSNNNNGNNQPPPAQQQPSSSSRVLRSTTERRRRANLFSSFYPLLSRSSSSSNSNSNSNSGNASPEINNNSNSGGVSSSSSSTSPVNSLARPGLTTSVSDPSTTTTATTTTTSRSAVRMYDEQSIRSTRSSSRASSLVAVSPPAHTPSASTTTPQTTAITTQGRPIEYMDIDTESVGVTAQHYQPPLVQSHSVMRPSVVSQSAASRFVTSATTASPTSAAAAPVRESGPRTRSTTTAVSQDHVSSSASSTTTALGSDNHSLFAGLSNPRGGTSISSSLFPIRPDSDDDDDMDHDIAMDRDQHSSAQSLRSNTHNPNHIHAHTHNHNHAARGRRYPGPELIADLIHHQILQSLQESASTAAPTPSNSSSTSATPGDATETLIDGEQDRGTSPGTAATAGNAAHLHRRRLRSSSMRGLFGFQPTNELADEERSTGSETGEGTDMDTGADHAAEGATRPGANAERIAQHIPFFFRLLAEISRVSQDATEAQRDQDEADRPVEANDGATSTIDPHATTTATAHGTDPLAESSAETGANARARRPPNATIRLIQFGPGTRPRPPGTTATGATGTAAAAAGTATGEEQGGEAEARNTIIMFLGPPPETMGEPESNDTAAPGSDDPESARTRPRQRSPWVVLTLSGAYLSSMLAAGAGGEGGSNYDDLWMLANMIGPARPITTTQEAIDNAGFAVGRFEQALQGMRNVTMLGDGSKCLVCMSEYEEGEDMRALKCNHGFHQECIDKWLTTGANKCPVCRAAAVVTETPMAAEPEVNVNPPSASASE